MGKEPECAHTAPYLLKSHERQSCWNPMKGSRAGKEALNLAEWRKMKEF